jgi:hypothetical protein
MKYNMEYKKLIPYARIRITTKAERKLWEEAIYLNLKGFLLRTVPGKYTPFLITGVSDTIEKTIES